MKKIIMAFITIFLVSVVVVVPRVVKTDKSPETTALEKASDNIIESSIKKTITSTLPENETVVEVSAKDGKLSWTEVDGVSSYSIYRSSSKDGDYQKIGVATENSYTDQSAIPGITYYYKYGYELPQNDTEDNSTSSDTTTTVATQKQTNPSKTTYKNTTSKVYTTAYRTTAKVTTTKARVTYTNPPTSAKKVTGFEQHMLDIMNAERKKVGAPALSFNPELTRLAQIRAAELATRYDAAHNRPDGRGWYTVFDDNNFWYVSAGENIAYGQPSSDAVIRTWIESPGHYANIVSTNFGHVGLACYEKNGVLYWEQLFTD